MNGREFSQKTLTEPVSSVGVNPFGHRVTHSRGGLRMRRFVTFLSAGTLVLLAFGMIAAGQDQPQKKGGKGGKGGFGGGFGGFGGGGGITDPVLLLRNESVKKEL